MHFNSFRIRGRGAKTGAVLSGVEGVAVVVGVGKNLKLGSQRGAINGGWRNLSSTPHYILANIPKVFPATMFNVIIFIGATVSHVVIAFDSSLSLFKFS